MAPQASSVLSSVGEEGWSDIDPQLRPQSSPVRSSSPVPSSVSINPDADDTAEGKVSQKRTSEVWDHSFYSRHKITLNKQGQSIWRCKYCSKTYVDSGGTSNAKKHLHKHHSRQIQSQNEKRVKGYQGQIDMAEFRAQSNAANRKRRRLDGGVNDSVAGEDGRGQGCDLNPDVLEQLYVTWITTCGVALEMVEKQEFRA
jgi:ribosomal protein L37AE/L43A